MDAKSKAEVAQVALLLRRRADIDLEIAALIGRPANKGHIGEFIAERVFNIALNQSASAKGHDGRFKDGPLQGQTVNVKFYAQWDGMLDMQSDEPPAYYLVLAGDGRHGWGINRVLLFAHQALVAGGVSPRTAASVRVSLSTSAMVYPTASAGVAITLASEEIALLDAFR